MRATTPRQTTPEEQSVRSAYGRGRLTPQRERVLAAAASMGAFTVEELASRLDLEPQATGLATVYRAVRALTEAGSLQRVGKRGSSDLYVWCVAEGHHHHLVCTGCGAVEHAPCPLGDAPSVPAEVAGYTVVGHDMTLWGLCPACSRLGKGE